MNDIMNVIIESLSKPVDNGFIGWLLFFLLWLITIIVAGLIIYLILVAINYLFMPIQEGYGEIVGMHYEPEHYSTTYVYNSVTKTSTPITTWHPNAWKLVIQINGCTDDFYLSKQDYIKHDVGERIPVTYAEGRLWKSISIKTATI